MGRRGPRRMIVLVGPGAVPGATLELDDAEAHHLRVRRADGELRVELRDGAGLIGTGVLRMDGKRGTVVVERAERRPHAVPLLLAVGAGDRDRFAWLVEKAAELGVTDIHPVETERTAGVATRVRAGAGALEKLRRRGLEALKQCGGTWAPAVHDPEPLAAFLARELSGTRWLADAAGAPPSALAATEPLTAIIGPEGGLTDAERAAIVAAGYRPVRLGALTLRFETAALAAAVHATAVRSGAGSFDG
ncbi:MAG TPA: RsmE family RNA methyltransferase [Gemmatimonadales bacterium]|nr:RsmE family RNA methyltransferase [Gemmatimonadales bacterium]